VVGRRNGEGSPGCAISTLVSTRASERRSRARSVSHSPVDRGRARVQKCQLPYVIPAYSLSYGRPIQEQHRMRPRKTCFRRVGRSAASPRARASPQTASSSRPPHATTSRALVMRPPSPRTTSNADSTSIPDQDALSPSSSNKGKQRPPHPRRSSTNPVNHKEKGTLIPESPAASSSLRPSVSRMRSR
jgi:hypothetical protein